MNGKLLQKAANALVPDAPMARWAKILLYWAVYPTIRASGGLWVGGTLTVADNQLRFAPNALNRIFLTEDVSFSIGLGEIRSVRVEPGTGTDIIVLATDRGERRVRCYGAKDFAAAIAHS
jgi:hypothetical protein